MMYLEPKIASQSKRLFSIFNFKSTKDGILEIAKICKKHNINSVNKQIACFLIQEKDNLNLAKIGNFVSLNSQQSRAILNFMTENIDTTGLSIISALRFYLQHFRLPGEAQQVGRVVEAFGKKYFAQNPNNGLANSDAAETLAFQAIMLSTDLHSGKIKNNMTIDELKRNLRGLNGGDDFDASYLEKFYCEVASHPFSDNCYDSTLGYEIISPNLNVNPVFKTLVQTYNKISVSSINKVLGKIESGLQFFMGNPVNWMNILFGFRRKGNVVDAEGNKLAHVDIARPGILRICSPHKTCRVSINLDRASECSYEVRHKAVKVISLLATQFKSDSVNLTSNYEYERKELTTEYRRFSFSEQICSPLDALEYEFVKYPLVTKKRQLSI